MKYDFNTIIDRQGKDAVAVDIIDQLPVKIKEGFSAIPMWVADMNFATVSTIQEAVIKRTQHPTFGYFFPREAYYDAIIQWQKSRNEVEGLTKEEISYENGVLGCVVSSVNAFTSPGEAVLIHAPTYIGFTHCLEDNGRKIILSHLKQDDEGTWRMDYEDMNKKIKENNIHCVVFCSPHNPCGRVWEKEELEAAMKVYAENECVVISDEIWSDLTLRGYRHIPTQSISEDAKNRTIAIYAPSKTFNLAGLIGSYHIIYNKMLRDRVRKYAASTHYNHMNVLSMYALIGAYEEAGYEWLEELKEVLTANVEYAYNYICEHFKGVTLAKPEGTYMLYLDCSKWCETHNKSLETLLHKGMSYGVLWQDGRPFNRPDTIRMNVALPMSLLKEGMKRLDQFVFNAC